MEHDLATMRWLDAQERADKSRNYVRGWLYFVALLVFAMVLVGGATRLTESGLSITEWKPIHGAIPPMNEGEWLEEFDKYKQIPQYQQINKGMSLDEFKFIFWWEWGHRQLGRFIGFAFALPMLFFWLTSRLTPEIKPRLVVLLIMGGLQGAVGWWMVASGLSERVDVSQYRLASHLTFACVIFFALLWVARGYRRQEHIPDCVSARRHVWWFGVLAILVIFQIFLGALVAGTDAGLTYNTWPLMDGKIIPDDLYAFDPAWLSPFEDHLTIQFNHRMVAYSLLLIGLIACHRLFYDTYAVPLKAMAIATVMLLGLQVLLGILTLILAVPLHLALAHQAGAVLVLASSTLVLRDLYDNYVL